jgi:RNA polymerase sigma-70 factor (ECF subfamily)
VKDPNNLIGSQAGAGSPSALSTGLLEGVKARDPEAWRRLAHLYGPLVYGWCRRQGLQGPDCEDVVQEVFLTIMARIGEFQRQPGGGAFRGWLWAIARHKLGDWLRSQKARAQPLDQHAGPPTALEAPDPEQAQGVDPPAAAEAGHLYRRALDLIRPEFADHTWQAFWRVTVDGQTAADVAADLHMSRNAVYIAKSRVLSRLRAVLGDA